MLVGSSWADGDKVTIWAFSNADSVELFVNGKSQGVQTMTQFSHVEWDNVAWEAGSIQVCSEEEGYSVGCHVWRMGW